MNLWQKKLGNCLLKTLEEPPEYATIILIASNESKLLNTIKSRCIKISFNKISDNEIEEYLKNNNIDTNNDEINFFDGSIGKALKIQENIEDYKKIEEIINNMDKKNLIYILNNSQELYKQKDIIYDLLEYLNILLLNSKDINRIKCIEYTEEAKKRLNSNSNYDMTIDNLLIKMWEQINVK